MLLFLILCFVFSSYCTGVYTFLFCFFLILCYKFMFWFALVSSHYFSGETQKFASLQEIERHSGQP